MSVAANSVVLASSRGCLRQYPLVGARIQAEDPDRTATFICDSAIVALSMDDANDEGLVGTENGTIYYTTDGELPTIESKRYTTPFFLTEDGQACQPAAFDDAAAQDSNSWECYVTLRALVAPARRMHPDRHGGSACLCLRHSPVSTQVFHVLSA